MKVIKWLDKNFELGLIAIALFIMCVLSFSNVIMRYCFHHALNWSDEVCCYLLALSAFYCLPCAVRRGVSLKVDTFTTMMPKKLQKQLGLVCDVFMVIVLALLFKGSLDIIQKATMIHQTTPALRYPVAVIYKGMAFGILLGIFRYIQLIIHTLQGSVQLESDNGKDFEKGKEDEE